MSKLVHICGNGREFSLSVEDRVSLWTRDSIHAEPLSRDEFLHAVKNALLSPVDYPPVSDGVVPGDVVAIVVDSEVPHPEVAIAGALQSLADCKLSRIDVVLAENTTESTRSAIRRSLPDVVELTIHSGKSRDDLRYLAANEAADPIYLNRRIIDADLVIPIVVARKVDPLLAGSSPGAVFPAFSDYQSQARARLNVTTFNSKKRRQRTVSADDDAARVGWLVGLQWIVSVELAVAGEPGAVIVGTAELLASRAAINDTSLSIPFAADVVVACIEGGQQQQSLMNLLRAAMVARGHASVDASIVLVTDLSELGLVADVEQDESALESTYDHEDEPDERPQLVQAPVASATDHARLMLHTLINDTDSSHRYLLFSNCTEDEAESFGFGGIQDASALERLINGHSSCGIIRTAQIASPKSDRSKVVFSL